MGAFDHIILLLSFVYALAIAHLLSTSALLIRRSARVRFSARAAFWMGNALVIILANWIGFWDLRALPSWSVGTILFTFVIAFTNYLTAALACPQTEGHDELDLVDFFDRQRVKILVSTLASCVTALVANVVYGQAQGVITWDQANVAVVPMTAGVLIALVWRGRAAQAIGPALITGAWIVYFTALQGALK
jgi:hypothetical protein